MHINTTNLHILFAIRSSYIMFTNLKSIGISKVKDNVERIQLIENTILEYMQTFTNDFI